MDHTLYDTGCLVYPGAYVPLLKEEEEQEELRRLQNSDTILPPVNITEMDGSFKVEIAIPGAKRESFLIYADGNILSVCIINKEQQLHKGENFQLHEFNYDCFDRHVVLPYNADTEFISAEYKAGILCLYVPKAKHVAENHHIRIVVY